MRGAIPPLPNTSSWHRDSFTFYRYFRDQRDLPFCKRMLCVFDDRDHLRIPPQSGQSCSYCSSVRSDDVSQCLPFIY
jgi:hypothetical protein